MAVIVHANENIDMALKRLHREVLREKILDTAREKAYRIIAATIDRDKRREWKKMKRRRRAARRRQSK
ncbi:MAG: bS21 family ribosomal protein [Candidatus Dojkabacteria bacterium]|nr:bS21 family ribosomal protein [Candidatus Dojkabacteria bacterium]